MRLSVALLFVVNILIPVVWLQAEGAKEVKLGPVQLKVAETWKQRQPSSNLRLGEFSIPAAEGDSDEAELSVFGPFGGSVEANVGRWIGQFDAEGREVKMTQGTGTQGKYVLVDLKGTYKKPVGPPIQGRTVTTPGYRMLAVMIVVEGEGNFFLKLTGAEKTIEAAAADFRGSFGGDASKEEPYAQ